MRAKAAELEEELALLHKAGQMQQERGYVVAFLEELKYSSEFHHMGRVLECRYLQGLRVEATARGCFAGVRNSCRCTIWLLPFCGRSQNGGPGVCWK